MKNYAYNYKKISAAKICEKDMQIVYSLSFLFFFFCQKEETRREKFKSVTKLCVFRNSISFK